MIVQIYKYKKENRILILKKDYVHLIENMPEYELIDEVIGDSWEECSRKISNSYFCTIK